MQLNWLAYNYRQHDGYGRYSSYLIKALRRAGVEVMPHFAGAADAPVWMRDDWGMDFSAPTISCLPPYYLRKLPEGSAPHTLLTMTEGSAAPKGWCDIINKSGVERLIVPCEWNAQAFRSGGVECEISVIAGGTEPADYSLISTARPDRPYTFLALADRGTRKGWDEVRQALYVAFGGKTTGEQDVRLIIKSRSDGNALINDHLSRALDRDLRIVFDRRDLADMRELYEQVDCFVIPSHGEGWGMPHREAAMMGLPVITQRYGGMDDGHTHKWALVVEQGQERKVESVKDESEHIAGFVRRCDVAELAEQMRWCYDNRLSAARFGQSAAQWLRAHQTWEHSAAQLLQLVAEKEPVLWL